MRTIMRQLVGVTAILILAVTVGPTASFAQAVREDRKALEDFIQRDREAFDAFRGVRRDATAPAAAEREPPVEAEHQPPAEAQREVPAVPRHPGVTIADWVHVDFPPSTEPQTVSFKDELKVIFPASALARGARASIGRVTQAPPTVFGFFDHLGMYEIGLEGRKAYDEDVVLEWRFDPAELDRDLPPEEQLIAARWDAEQAIWVELPSTIHVDRGLIVARTRRLSIATTIKRLPGRVGRQLTLAIQRSVFVEGTKRLIKTTRWTRNFELLYSVSDLLADADIAAWRGESYDEEFGYLWKYQHPEWIPFIRDIAYYLEKSLAEYLQAGSNNNVRCFKPHSSMTTFEVGPGMAGPNRGGAFNYFRGRGYLSTDAYDLKGGWAKRHHFKHNAAHELFHAIQHNKVVHDPEKAVEPEAIWWMESNADYAAAFVAWPGNTALADRAVYPLLLREPITVSGPFGDADIEYAKSHFIDHLVRNGANFPKMHKEVMEGLALTGEALTALETHLSRHSPKGMPAHYRDFAVRFYLSEDSPLPADREPGDSGTQINISAGPDSQTVVRHTFPLRAPYTTLLWAGAVVAQEPPVPGLLSVTAESLPASARLEFFLQDGYGPLTDPQPVAVMTKAGDTALIPVSGLEDPDPQLLYALAMNLHNQKPADVAMVVERLHLPMEISPAAIPHGSPDKRYRFTATVQGLPDALLPKLRVAWTINGRTDGLPPPAAPQVAGGRLTAVLEDRRFEPGAQVVLARLHTADGLLLAEAKALVNILGDAGFWVLDESERKPPGERTGYTTVKLGEHEFETKADFKHKSYAYEATGFARWEALPKVVPNGADWRMPVRAHFRRQYTQSDSSTIVLRLPVKNESAGFSVRTAPGGATTRPQSEEEKRGIFATFIAGPAPHPAERSGIRWHTVTRQDEDLEDAVTIPFPLIPPNTGHTDERYEVYLNAWVADAGLHETHAYRWAQELPKELEADFRREVGRANFLGARSWTKDMTAAPRARPVTLDAPARLAEGTTAVMSDLRYLPSTLRVGQEAAFEISIENGPDTPTFSWYFGVGPPKQANVWTEATQTRFTFMKPGVYTVRVTVADKNAYTRGLLAEGAWQISVVPTD